MAEKDKILKAEGTNDIVDEAIMDFANGWEIHVVVNKAYEFFLTGVKNGIELCSSEPLGSIDPYRWGRFIDYVKGKE